MKNVNLNKEKSDLSIIESMGFEVQFVLEKVGSDGNRYGYYRLIYGPGCNDVIYDGGTDEDLYSDKCDKERFASICLEWLATENVVMVTNGDPDIIYTDAEMQDFITWLSSAQRVDDMQFEDETEQKDACERLGIPYRADCRTGWGKVYKVTSRNPNACGYFSIRQ